MIYAGPGVYLQECRILLSEGNAYSALTMIREALKALKESAPIAWTGAGQGYKSKVGDFIKRKAREKIGINGKARKDAMDAYQKGQHTLGLSQKIGKDADDAVKHGDAEKAIGAHNAGVKAHQAAMADFKRTMDRANKEGDRETADWAAKAGAVHTAQRAFHMKQGAEIRKWAMKNKADGQKAAVQAKVASTAAQKPGSSASADYKAHMQKVAATNHAKAQAAGQQHAPTAAPSANPARGATPPNGPAPKKVSPSIGKKPAGRKPAALRIKKQASDTAGATKIRVSS